VYHFLDYGIGDSNLDGSKFCKVMFPPERYLAFLGEQVQSTPNAEAVSISPRANQHPFPKTITERHLPMPQQFG
jgi:hypothetical protein